MSTNCHQARGRTQWVSIDFAGRAGFVKAAVPQFWQPGLPAGMPACKTSPTTFRKWIRLGDSYASGTGAHDYLDTECWRSSNSYWSLLRDQLKHGLFAAQSDFNACHGATTETVRERQIPPRDPATRLLTISVGGNDMHFARIMQTLRRADRPNCEEALEDAFTATPICEACVGTCGRRTVRSVPPPRTRPSSCSAIRSSRRPTMPTTASRSATTTRRSCTAPADR